MDQETQAEAKKVERLLDEIKENTSLKPARNFYYGMLYGAGIVLGTILAVIAVGWILSILGVIPGFDVIANNISDILNKRY